MFLLVRKSIYSIIGLSVLLVSCSKPVTKPISFERSPKLLMKLVAERQLHELSDGDYIKGDWSDVQNSKTPGGVSWNYPWGVTLYGLLRTSTIINDSDMVSFVLQHNEIAAEQFAYLQWQREQFGDYVNDAGLRQLMILTKLDHCGAMTSQLLEGVLQYNAEVTPEMDALIKVVADYISSGQSRLPDGTLWRPERQETIWADDLYMSCPFLARYSHYVNDTTYLNDAAKQILNMASYLQDKDGVWFHGYAVAEKRVTGFKWGRANGWVMVATAEVLSLMSESHPQFQDVLTVLKKHINGIIPLQASSGRWHQVLDHPELWEETSCTSMFTYVISRAVRKGWIDDDYMEIADKAIKGLNKKITEDGAILDVCRGTSIGYDLNFYVNRSRPYDDHHGQGPMLLGLTEYVLAKEMM